MSDKNTVDLSMGEDLSSLPTTVEVDWVEYWRGRYMQESAAREQAERERDGRFDHAICQYCYARIPLMDTAALENHWKECPKHPARQRIETLRVAAQKLLDDMAWDDEDEIAWEWVEETHLYNDVSVLRDALAAS